MDGKWASFHVCDSGIFQQRKSLGVFFSILPRLSAAQGVQRTEACEGAGGFLFHGGSRHAEKGSADGSEKKEAYNPDRGPDLGTERLVSGAKPNPKCSAQVKCIKKKKP